MTSNIDIMYAWAPNDKWKWRIVKAGANDTYVVNWLYRTLFHMHLLSKESILWLCERGWFTSHVPNNMIGYVLGNKL